MGPIDNSQFTEGQQTEAFRREVTAQLMRQAKAQESIRSILIFFFVVFMLGFVIAVLVIANNGGWL